MKYIPGFSNYLRTSVPRYARGGRVVDGEPMMYDMGDYGGDQIMYDMGVYNEPVYQQPVYQEPAYVEPYVDPYQYQQPVYQEPMYQEPVYQQPYYEPYQYQQPVYQEPAYAEPSYMPAAEQPYVEPYQYQQPVYQEPAYMPAAEQPFAAPYMPAAEQPYVSPYVEPYLPATEQPYVEPYQYLPATEQPYVAPYTPAAEQPYVEPYVAPQAERQFGSPRYNGEDIYNSAPVEQPYVPGFTNYLEASIPPYVAPAEAAAPYVEPYQPMPTAQPMTQEAAPADAPFDLSTLDFSGLAGLDLSGLNFASNFGGGAMGGIYQPDPNVEYISAPLSNKGNATSQTGGNTFAVRTDQPVRLVDHRTNTVIFEGTGFDAARKATELGQGLTDSGGRKANYSIQTADPTGNYSTVAYEKKNKSTLGQIANVAGTLLPLATMFIPGLNVLGTIAAGAGLGGAGAALKGDNILKGIAMGGLSAAGGQVLGPALEAGGKFGTALAPKLATAVGTGIGSTAGGLATGQSLKNSLLGGVASGALSYVAPTIANELGIKPINLNGTKGTSGSSGMTADGGLQVTATTLGTPSIGTTLGGSPNKIQQALAEKPFDGITATGSRLGTVGFDGDLFGADRFGTPGKDVSAFDRLTDTADPNDIVVDATTRTTPVSVPVTSVGGGEITPEYLPKEDIVVDATTRTTPVSVPVTGDGFRLEPEVLSEIDKLSEAERKAEEERKKLGLEEYLRLAGLAAGLIGGGAGGGSGSSGTYTRGGRGLNSIFSAKLPTTNIPGGVGSASNFGVRRFNDEDYLTYGTRPERSFFNYVPDNRLPTPITTPIPNEPRGPSMYVPDRNRFAEGGAFAAKRGGSSDRTEFAVNGPGTGRSDDIPAVLSDGEYVIDAETVALLGDGSSKAGAKKLDELRIKVRKHKGQKLAKGRFSANAKKPEAYLSGGRI